MEMGKRDERQQGPGLQGMLHLPDEEEFGLHRRCPRSGVYFRHPAFGAGGGEVRWGASEIWWREASWVTVVGMCSGERKQLPELGEWPGEGRC